MTRSGSLERVLERDLVSVIVPTRNSARTLEACLESIARQSHAEVETIVVDNASSDETREIASRFECALLDIGPERSAQRNQGARHAKGAHLLFVDSDMVLEPNVVADCVAAARAGATAAIVPEVSFGEGFWAQCKRLERSCYVGDDDIEAARFYERALFARLGGFDEQLNGPEDWDLSRRAASAGATIVRVPSLIRHDEGRLELSVLLRKKFRYGKSYRAYRKVHGGGQQARLLRPAFVRNRDALAAEPGLASGMLVMKLLEFSAGAAGALTELASRTRQDRATDSPTDPKLNAYARRHLHFVTEQLPPLLRDTARRGVIADLGCGDGAILHALHRSGHLGEPSYGIDVSDVRVDRAESIPGVVGIVADATTVPLPEESVDGVVCSQVIEHVPDEPALVHEIARLLRPGGWWYIGSCLRGPRAWWIYRRDGVWLLDPTHVREYRDEREFRQAIEHDELEVGSIRSEPMRYPVLDLALRAFGRDGRFYERHPWALRLRSVRLRVPGYGLVEAAGRKRA
jgi:glycosyltransferase involved in cell wall biosynthesis